MRRNAGMLFCGVSALLVLVAGAGLADDPETAKLRQAAERGNPVAQLRLASLIDPGLTTLSAGLPDLEDADPEDYVEAAKWYRLAAEQGEPGAQRALGRLYLRGNGVEQNVCESPDGSTGLPCKGTVWPSTGLAPCTRRTVLCRTTPWPRGGTGGRPNKGTRGRSCGSASCTGTARACRRTTLPRTDGSILRRSTVASRRRSLCRRAPRCAVSARRTTSATSSPN